MRRLSSFASSLIGSVSSTLLTSSSARSQLGSPRSGDDSWRISPSIASTFDSAGGVVGPPARGGGGPGGRPLLYFMAGPPPHPPTTAGAPVEALPAPRFLGSVAPPRLSPLREPAPAARERARRHLERRLHHPELNDV